MMWLRVYAPVHAVLASALLVCPLVSASRGASLEGAGFSRMNGRWYLLEEEGLGPGAGKMAIHLRPNVSRLSEVRRISVVFHGVSSRLATNKYGALSRFNWHPHNRDFVRVYLDSLRKVGEVVDAVVLVQSSGRSWPRYDWKTGKQTGQRVAERLRSRLPSLERVLLEGHSGGYQPIGRTAQAFLEKDSRGKSVTVEAFVLRDAFYGHLDYLLDLAKKGRKRIRIFAFNSTTTTCRSADTAMGRLREHDTISAGGETLVIEHERNLYRTYLNVPTEGGTKRDTAMRHSMVFHPLYPHFLQLPYRAFQGDWDSDDRPPQLDLNADGEKCYWKRLEQT
ncbi:hypothetical protein ACFL6C_10725 [Myxococcota bacterium]